MNYKPINPVVFLLILLLWCLFVLYHSVCPLLSLFVYSLSLSDQISLLQMIALLFPALILRKVFFFARIFFCRTFI